MERKISRMEWKTIFHSSISIPHWISLMAFNIRVAKGGGGLNCNATNDKNVTKNAIVSLVSVSFSIFAYNSTRVQY